MADPAPRDLPLLPLVLWGAPPALAVMLDQEGVPYHTVGRHAGTDLCAGRFVVADCGAIPRRALRESLTPEHVLIGLEELRGEESADPFATFLSQEAAEFAWDLGGLLVCERVACVPRARIRGRVLARLRRIVTARGGLWARLGAFPHPYRSAFNLRLDLDEPVPDDYFGFARARRGLEDCTTHFISTSAYGDDPRVLDDLRGLDSQSHGHHHAIYRDPRLNERNLRRADEVLRACGFAPVGFAAPGGTWRPDVDRVLEQLGYSYASDFGVGHDDRPFFPIRDGRPSNVIQVPVHPICEGLFLDAGCQDVGRIAAHLVDYIQDRYEAREPAFVYGHPERRLGRMPQVVAALARVIAGRDRLWRVTLTDFARWWRWRLGCRWSVHGRPDGSIEVRLSAPDRTYLPSLEVTRGEHVADVPLDGPLTCFRADLLSYERLRHDAGSSLPGPVRRWRPPSLKRAMRRVLDWETVTPLAELPSDTLRARLKKGLRLVRSRGVRL